MKPGASIRRLLLAAFVVAFVANCAAGGKRYPPPAECPQPRFTGQAPEALRLRVNPLAADAANLAAGRELYLRQSEPACRVCHGDQGRGNGPLAGQFDPRPRNFSCAATIDGIADGQLAWIIENGSPGTVMPPFPGLSEKQVWQLVLSTIAFLIWAMTVPGAFDVVPYAATIGGALVIIYSGIVAPMISKSRPKQA